MVARAALPHGRPPVQHRQELVVALGVRRQAVLDKVGREVALRVGRLHGGEAQRPDGAAAAALREQRARAVSERRARGHVVEEQLCKAREAAALRGELRTLRPEEILHSTQHGA